MATNLLVTGSHGGDDPHVESKHDALMHAAMLGRSGYILKTRNWTMKPTAKDANNITIPAWDLVVEGRQIYIAAPTDVNIQSGSQGQKRRDLIVARYALNSGTGVETVTLEVIKGKPSAATPADPGIETGSIIGGAIVSDLPLCRVNLDGITITSIDTLVNVMQPLEDVWDSLTHCGLIGTATDREGMVTADNPFRTTDGVFVLCQLCPNGMSDAAGKLFEAFFWDMTDSRLRFRIRRANNHEWVNDRATRARLLGGIQAAVIAFPNPGGVRAVYSVRRPYRHHE